MLRILDPEKVPVDLERAGEAEMDEMGSFVGNTGNPRWLWHAIDHDPGAVVASVFGRRPDAVFLRDTLTYTMPPARTNFPRLQHITEADPDRAELSMQKTESARGHEETCRRPFLRRL